MIVRAIQNGKPLYFDAVVAEQIQAVPDDVHESFIYEASGGGVWELTLPVHVGLPQRWVRGAVEIIDGDIVG